MHIADLSPLPLGGVESLSKDGLAGLLEEARGRTLAIVEPLSEEQIDRQYFPIMSPLAWDLGHIAAFADLWLARAADAGALRPDLFEVYDATETPRSRRGDLPFLPCEDALAYGREVLARALAVLEDVDVSARGDRLNADGFVWQMLIQHEHQHNETMLQAMQLAGEDMPPPAGFAFAHAKGTADSGPQTVAVAGGRALVGADALGFAYDNERPQHHAEVEPFELDRTPVSNGAYLAWIEDGGYHRREWWSPAGWSWRERERIEHPLYWTADGRVRRFDRTEPIDPDLPVTHVSWHEADAFARAHDARLPTEQEWEKAATWNPVSRRKRRFPWGNGPPTDELANLDVTTWGPDRADVRAEGASAYGALGMTGDVWEWTASEFSAYPSFAPFPYREYSQIFYGTGLRVLRGGSWATRPTIARPTFRNWDLPERRQLFVGFRCARDARMVSR